MKRGQELVQKYIHLFEPEEVRSDMKQSCMYWGIETGDGWYDLIDKMMQEISDLKKPDFCFTQIKEKFGTLRVYTNYYYEDVEAIIEKYEAISAVTCEVCGKPGTINDGGWLRVRCEEHKE
jgi:hypothetical protein